MKRRLVLLLAVFALIAVSAAPVGARGHEGNAPENFRAHLNGGNEVPAVDTNGQGQAIFQLRGDALHYKLIVANIDEVTQAHIHCGAPDVNGPVVAFLFGSVDGGTTVNGILSQGTLGAGDVIPREPSSLCPGGVANFDDMIDKLRSGEAYVNVHTLANPPGEIRGQIH